MGHALTSRALTRLCVLQAPQNDQIAVLQALLGQGAQVVLDGQKVLPSRTLEQGFSFQYTELDPAIRQLLR